jgi:hypothetical protein
MRIFVVFALALAIGLGTAVSPFASSAPDGLNRVAENHAFGDQGRLNSLQEDSPVPGYAFPGVENEKLAKGLAGFVGTLVVFGLGYGIATVARRRPTLA